MTHFIQMHNAAKLGWVPLDSRPFLQTQLSVWTRRPSVRRAVGGTVFVVVRLGRRPGRYYLWECFRVEGVQAHGDSFCAWGTGWQLVPPQPLHGPDFEAFRRACAYFVGFRAVDRLPYRQTLLELAQRFRSADVTAAAERFCTELLGCLPPSGDLCYCRGWVRLRLGDRAGARADLNRAVELGGELSGEALRLLRRTEDGSLPEADR